MMAPEDALEERLSGALREVGQQAPPVNTNASELGRPSRLRADVPRRGWTRPLVAAAIVAAVGGVAAVAWQNTSVTGDDVGVDHGVVSSPSLSPSASPRDETPASKSAVDRQAGRATAFEFEPGYGRVSVNYDSGVVDVFWKGQPPEALKQLAARSGDVTLTIHEAKYSEADINAAARRLIRAKPSDVDGARVVLVMPNADLSGATVSVLRPWDGDESLLRDVAGVPIKIVSTDEGVQPAGD